MIPRICDVELGESEHHRPDEKARKAGKARHEHLLATTAGFPAVTVELANCIMGTRRQRRAGTPAERVAALAEQHGAAIRDVLRRRLRPGVDFKKGSSGLALVPFVIVAFYLARMLWMLSRPPHAPSMKFMGVSDDAEDALDSWTSVGNAIFEKPRERDAWDFNCGAAGGWTEVLRNKPPRVLALVRHCWNRACPRPFFLLHSGRREPRFCSRSGCRQAFHRRHTADD